MVARQCEELLDAMLFKRANDNVGTSQHLCHLWSNSRLLKGQTSFLDHTRVRQIG
jgi:hypothetical protein